MSSTATTSGIGRQNGPGGEALEPPVHEHQENTGRYPNLQPPWQPGESGNLKGRPPGRSITAALRKIAEADNEAKKLELAQVVWDRALAGDFRFVEELIDRLDGKVSEEVHTVMKMYGQEAPIDDV